MMCIICPGTSANHTVASYYKYFMPHGFDYSEYRSDCVIHITYCCFIRAEVEISQYTSKSHFDSNISALVFYKAQIVLFL